MTSQRKSSWERVKKTPFLELLTSAAIVLSNTLLSTKPRLVSDMLFLEGMTLSVIGALIAGRISEAIALPSFVKRKNNVQSQPNIAAGHGFMASLHKKKTGLRILFVGLMLVATAIVIGEAIRPR